MWVIGSIDDEEPFDGVERLGVLHALPSMIHYSEQVVDKWNEGWQAGSRTELYHRGRRVATTLPCGTVYALLSQNTDQTFGLRRHNISVWLEALFLFIIAIRDVLYMNIGEDLRSWKHRAVCGRFEGTILGLVP